MKRPNIETICFIKDPFVTVLLGAFSKEYCEFNTVSFLQPAVTTLQMPGLTWDSPGCWCGLAAVAGPKCGGTPLTAAAAVDWDTGTVSERKVTIKHPDDPSIPWDGQRGQGSFRLYL